MSDPETPQKKQKVSFGPDQTMGQLFVARDTITMKMGQENVQIYPVRDDMTQEELSFAFQTNRQSIENSDLSPAAKLAAMAQVHRLTSVVNVNWASVKAMGQNAVFKPDNMTLRSYHDRLGNEVPDCLDANGQIKPVQNGAVNACRPNSIYYAKVTVEVDLSDYHADIDPVNLTYFIRLPVSSQVVTNAAGVDRTLVKMALDFSDNVAHCKLLDADPFELFFKAPACGPPAKLPVEHDSADPALKATVNAINKCEAFIESCDEGKRKALLEAANKKMSEVSVDFDIRDGDEEDGEIKEEQ
jgi:hypothetical protein